MISRDWNTESRINFRRIHDSIPHVYNQCTEYYSRCNQEQIKALVLDKRNEKLTIKERAQYCAKSGDPYDIYLHALDLIKTKNSERFDVDYNASNTFRRQPVVYQFSQSIPTN